VSQARILAGTSNVRSSIILLLALVGVLLVSSLCITVMIAAATGNRLIELPEMPWAAKAGPAKPEAGKQDMPPEIAPQSDPAALRPISQSDALAANAAIPLSDLPNPAAGRFLVSVKEAGSWTRSLDCLTAAIYYEAASEGDAGMRAVAQVVLNRVRHPAYPHSVCGVVFQGSERKTGCQFTFTCDGALARTPSRSGWARSQAIASAALGGYVYQPVGWSTHYHTNWVVPYWASSLVKTANVGSHIFYRWTGGWGQAGAFTARYAGLEPVLDWRAGEGVAAAAEETPVAATTVPLGDRLPSMADRPVIAAAPNAAKEGVPSRAYVLSDRRWVLGGVMSDDEARAAAAPSGNSAATVVNAPQPAAPAQ
jgi:spore germination cell wall hydrolase CwlJ-like protein